MPTIQAAPIVSGSAVAGQTVSTTTGTWSGTPAPTYTYQWRRCNTSGENCSDIAGAAATAESYQLVAADVGWRLYTRVTATNSAGSATHWTNLTATVTDSGAAPAATTTPGAAAAATTPPRIQAPPVVSGSAVVGQTVSTTTGTWLGTPAPTYTYQWRRCNTSGENCSDIAGAAATAESYQLVAADVGWRLYTRVTATNSAGSATHWTNLTATVAASGGSDGSASGSGGSGSSGSGSGGSGSSGSGSDGSGVSGAAPSVSPKNVTPPILSGSAVVGQTVSTTTGTWLGTPAPTYTYQWRRCNTSGRNCSDIAGAAATAESYQLVAADVGWRLYTRVTATNSAGSATHWTNLTATVAASGGSDGSASGSGGSGSSGSGSGGSGVSGAAPSVSPKNVTPPILSGSAVVGQTVSTTTGTWLGTPAPTYTYQWRRCNTSGRNCSDIAGATGQTYPLARADVNSRLDALVTATNSARSSSLRTSQSAVVAAAPPPPPSPPIPAGATVLPRSFKGTYQAKPGEVITAAGPLSDVSIRVSVANVVIRDIDFLNATRDRTRPATIDASGSANLKILNVNIRGDGTQQAQGVYMAGGSGLVVRGGSCVDPGNDRFFDHCLYLNGAKNFLVENWTGRAAHGAVLHAYSGGTTGIARNVDFGRSAWNVVAWGQGNDIVLEGCKLHDAYKVENGRGYAIEAAAGGKVTVRNCHIWNASSAGNVSGKPGIMQNGGTFVDAGGNVFAPPS